MPCVSFQPSVMEDHSFSEVAIGLLVASISLAFLVWACEFGEMPVWPDKIKLQEAIIGIHCSLESHIFFRYNKFCLRNGKTFHCGK